MELYKYQNYGKIIRKAYGRQQLFVLLAAFCLLVNSGDINGQQFADSKGRDFWVTFMPNFHNNYWNTDPYYQRGDSLYIFLTSDKPARVSIEYYDRNGTQYSDIIDIVNTSDVYIFKKCYIDFELLGINRSGEVSGNFDNEAEEIAHLSFHITSDEDINVYAHNQAVTTSEAMMIFPTDALGYDYFIMSYCSNDGRGSYESGSSTPSQFSIIATADTTSITILPSCPTHRNGWRRQEILLNKGDVYLVQAQLSFSGSNNDLTGTEINSDKPIAVFGGHQRTKLPVDMTGTSPSRDYLIEQLPPVSTWGKSAFLTTYPQLPDMTSDTKDIYRILAANDDTEVFINEKYVTTLHKGQYYENVLTIPGIVFATGPVLVAQFKRTSQSYDGNGLFLPPGDPFMMVVPPKEQFMKFYRVINTQAWQVEGGFDGNYYYEKVYDYQYISITSPDSAIGTVKLDGGIVPASQFKQIPGSGFSYANIRVADGVHSVEADSPIGIYVFGYGGANSYGYVGGMSFVPFDYKKPLLSVIAECFKVTGNLSDSLLYDTGISEINEISDSNINTKVTIDNYKKLQTKVGFAANLRNTRHDGKFALKTIDGYKNIAVHGIEIPGFTIGIKGASPEDNTVIYSYETRIQKEFCFEIPITNYGKFTQKINELKFRNNIFRIQNQGISEIKARENINLTICENFNEVGIYKDTLIIVNDCGNWDLAIVTIESKKDDNPPNISIKGDSCNREYFIAITDSLPTDFGLYSIRYNELINCTVGNISQDERQHLSVISVTNPFRDAIYDITVQDSFGLVSNIRDTIQGFTLSLGYVNDDNTLNFGKSAIGYRNCDSIRLINYGLLPLVFNDAYVFQDVLFSVPQSHFPVIIQPGSEIKLPICLNTLAFIGQPVFDSIRFDFNCLGLTASFEGIAAGIESNGAFRCNIPVKIITNSVPESFFVEQNIPNPVYNSMTEVIFGIPAGSNVAAGVSDLAGRELIKFDFGYMAKGAYCIEFDLNGLPSGVYIYTIKACNSKIDRIFVKEN